MTIQRIQANSVMTVSKLCAVSSLHDPWVSEGEVCFVVFPHLSDFKKLWTSTIGIYQRRMPLFYFKVLAKLS